MKLDDYIAFNSSFQDKFIYRLGGSTGFFSEYNNMVLAMHYCMVNHYQFVLESEGANFLLSEGWNDFFLPFCKEVRGKWLRKFNYRIKPTYKNKWEWFNFNVYKRLHPHYSYMYMLFNTVRGQDVNRTYTIEPVGLDGTLLENCSEIHKMIWRYNPSVKKDISSLIASLGIPSNHAGIHIRQGDKYEEAMLYDPDNYIHHLQRYTDERNVFILTDDFRVITKLRTNYPDYQFFTLCQPDERGYSLSKLLNSPKEEQRKALLRLFASMDVLEDSIIFVGTYSANPGMNMGFRLDKGSIKCIDFDVWQLW